MPKKPIADSLRYNRRAKPHYDTFPESILAYGQRNLKMPPWQREGNVWTKAMKQKFISTIIKGEPVPPIMTFATDTNLSDDKNAQDWCNDGQQRTNAIKEFLNGEFSVPLELLDPVLTLREAA